MPGLLRTWILVLQDHLNLIKRGEINLHFLADAFICTQLLMLRGTQSDVCNCKAHACESNLQGTFNNAHVHLVRR
jgi:hypothetical protein